MNYIVLDLEWNQAYNKKAAIKSTPALSGEIIQIGAVKLDENFHSIDTFKILVSPKYYKKLHQKVAKITKISQEDLLYGFPFPVAYKHFQEWCGKNYVLLTWGTTDIEILKSNLSVHKINSSISSPCYDLQPIFDYQITHEKRQVSLSYALEKVNEPIIDVHDALNDARNTAVLCQHLDMIKGLNEYSYAQKYIVNNFSFGKAFDSESKIYKNAREGLLDKELVTFTCPICGKNVSCTEFTRQNASKIISKAYCENGEKFFVRFKFIKLSNNNYRATRNIYELSKENEEYYSSRKQAVLDKKLKKWNRINVFIN